MILQVVSLFLLDFITFEYFNTWATFTLLMLLITHIVDSDFMGFRGYFLIFLFIIQNAVLTGRFGLCVVYLVLMFLLVPRLRLLFKQGSILPHLSLLLLGLFGHYFLYQWLIIEAVIPLRSTVFIVFVNIVLMVTSLKIKRL